MVAAALAPALGTALGISTAAATTAINVASYIAVTAASYFIQQSMQPKPEVGTKLRAASGGNVAQSMLVGEKECSGSLIYVGTWGKVGKTPNGYLVRVYALADVPIDGFLDRVWISGQRATLGPADATIGTGPDEVNVGKRVLGIDDLYVKIKLGDQTTADPYLVAKFGTHPTKPWSSSMIGRGRALMIVTQRLNKKNQQSAWEVTPVLRGALWYDWRKDSTNGGSGSHRWGDYSTYEYSANPIVVAYNIMRGVYRASTWLYGGLNWPARRLDVDTWTAAANKCDENVPLAAGGTQKRYRMGAEILFSEQPLAVLDRCFAACNARLCETGGIYKVYAGGIGASVFSFNDSNIVVTEGLTGNLFPQKEDICNTIAGSYVEPENGGQMKAYRKRFKQDYIDEDRGEVRASELSFDYVRVAQQAQRLAMHALNDNRRFDTKVVAFPPTARKLEPGDVVNWTASARFGYVTKKFIVGDPILTRYGVVLVPIREVDATDADWDVADEYGYDVDVLDDDAEPDQTLTATITSFGITDDSGNDRRPGIRIQAAVDEDFVDCEALLYRVRKSASNTRIFMRGRSDGFFDPSSDDYGDIVFTDNSFLPGRTVQVSHKIKPESDRETSWSGWTSITLTNARLKVQDLDTGDANDIDAIVTRNIRPKTVEGRFNWTSPSRDYSFTVEDNPKTASQGLSGASPIVNPNPSTVLLRITGKIGAIVLGFTGPRGSVVTMTTKITVYSAPVSGAGVVLEGQKVVIYTTSVGGKLERTMTDKIKGGAGSKSINAFVFDSYDGEDGNALRRKYWAEVDYKITPDKYSVDASADGSVKGFSVRGSYSKV